MWNALTFVGMAVAALGIGFAIYSLVNASLASIRWWGQRQLPAGDGVWSGAIREKDAYVPGTVKLKLALVVVGFAGAGLSAPLIWAGIALADFQLVREPRAIAKVFAAAQGTKLVVEPVGRENSVHLRPGRVIIANAEYISFAEPLTRMALGPYFRLTHLGGYPSRISVLERTGGGRIDLAPPHPLFAYLERVSRVVPSLVTVSRRMSRPMPDTSPAELWAVPFAGVGEGDEGLEWRR